jgi:hypothetical protein
VQLFTLFAFPNLDSNTPKLRLEHAERGGPFELIDFRDRAADFARKLQCQNRGGVFGSDCVRK